VRDTNGKEVLEQLMIFARSEKTSKRFLDIGRA